MAIHFSRFARLRIILFRIFYSTSFTIVFLLVVAFAAAGVIDSVYQSYRRRRLIDIFSITGAYVLTGLISIFLYASRLYTNRSILRDIPKTYMPTDKGEVGNGRMWRLIEDCKSKSAVTAYLARPRSRRIELEIVGARERINTLLKPEHSKEQWSVEAQCSVVSHRGWTGPAAQETPNLEYNSVVCELLDLIEARAVSLVPIEKSGTDEALTAGLQRPETAGMRDYVHQLAELGVLDYDSLTLTFLTHYEKARFGLEPLSELAFQNLMRMFAEILRNMRPLSPAQVKPEYISTPSTTSSRQPSIRQQIARSIGAQHHPSTLGGSSKGSSLAGSVRRHSILPEPTSYTHLASSSMIPPRISNDSVRSLSSNSAYHDPEDHSWAEPTNRPPFFHSSSSTSSRNEGHRVAQQSRRSRLRQRASRGSVATASTEVSRKSAISNGSVIRLNANYDGSREQLPFEYLSTVQVDEPGTSASPSRRHG